MTIAQTIAPGTIKLPPGKWIPNPDQISDTAAGLLAVVGGALDQFGIGKEFERRLFTHGTPAVTPGENKMSQLFVNLHNLEIGKAGQKQFSYDDGALGKYALLVAEFDVQLWIPWATPVGGLSARAAPDEAVMESSFQLNKALLVAFSALRALSLGGVVTNPPVAPIVQDHMIVGPATPLGPDGAYAGWNVTVQVEY